MNVRPVPAFRAWPGKSFSKLSPRVYTGRQITAKKRRAPDLGRLISCTDWRKNIKKLAFVVLALWTAVAWAGTEPNSADYTISVHVSSARVNGRGAIRLKVTLDGKKCELEGLDAESSLLKPGDYKAKMIPVKMKDVHTDDVYGSYEFLFPDMKTRRYGLVGISE
jgi:hypothetical protein